MESCLGCQNRNTAEHENPDCHTTRCECWRKQQEAKEAAYQKKREVMQAEGVLALGYNRSKSRWINSNQNKKQSTKWRQV